MNSFFSSSNCLAIPTSPETKTLPAKDMFAITLSCMLRSSAKPSEEKRTPSLSLFATSFESVFETTSPAASIAIANSRRLLNSFRWPSLLFLSYLHQITLRHSAESIKGFINNQVLFTIFSIRKLSYSLKRSITGSIISSVSNSIRWISRLILAIATSIFSSAF